MRLLTFAAGVAAGYVLGTRAGREKYEQIVDGARRLRANPTVTQAEEKVKGLIGTGTGTGGTTTSSTGFDSPVSTSGTTGTTASTGTTDSTGTTGSTGAARSTGKTAGRNGTVTPAVLADKPV